MKKGIDIIKLEDQAKKRNLYLIGLTGVSHSIKIAASLPVHFKIYPPLMLGTVEGKYCKSVDLSFYNSDSIWRQKLTWPFKSVFF